MGLIKTRSDREKKRNYAYLDGAPVKGQRCLGYGSTLHVLSSVTRQEKKLHKDAHRLDTPYNA